MTIEVLLMLLLAGAALNVFGLLAPRGVRSMLHDVAFFAGLLGLVAIPVVVFAFLVLLAQHIVVSASSPAGMAFQVAGAVVWPCGLVSAGAAVAILRRRESAISD